MVMMVVAVDVDVDADEDFDIVGINSQHISLKERNLHKVQVLFLFSRVCTYHDHHALAT